MSLKYRIEPDYMSENYDVFCRVCNHWGSSGCLATDAVKEDECQLERNNRR